MKSIKNLKRVKSPKYVFKVLIQNKEIWREHFLYAESKGEALELAVDRKLLKRGENIIEVKKCC